MSQNPRFEAALRILNKLPTPFFVILGLGCALGCILFVVMGVLTPRVQKEIEVELYPRYAEIAAQSNPEILKNTVTALTGQWAAEKDDTVFLVIFFPNANFSWQIYEKMRPAYTIYAGGPYISGAKEGEILLSSQLEKGLLVPGYRPYYRLNDMKFGENLFGWKIVKGALILTPLEPNKLPENVKNLWDSFAPKGSLAFRPVVGAEKSR
ncbi:MAG: hypothetical protein AB7E85_07015 [Pseudobdellovibrionaceae bacterium]